MNNNKFKKIYLFNSIVPRSKLEIGLNQDNQKQKSSWYDNGAALRTVTNFSNEKKI